MIENQLSTKFKGISLGFSKVYTINDSGCLTACLARLLNLPLLEVHQKLKDGGCFYNECLLDLTKVPRVYPQLSYIGKFAYDNVLALETISSDGIVIAEVDYNPIMDGTQQHFVCMVGGGNIEDPLGGKIKPVTNYQKYLTLRVFRIKDLPVSSSDNMTEQEKLMLDFIRVNQMTEGQLREGFGYIKEGTVAKQSKEIEDLKKSLADLIERVGVLESEVKASNDLVVDWQSKYSSATSNISKLEKEIKDQSDEKNQWKNRYEAKCKETADKLSVWELLTELKSRIFKSLGKK